MNFEDLKLAPAILRAVAELGYTQPTPVQAQTIPLVLQGHDILAGAQTGTGKTAAFALPMLQLLDRHAAPAAGAIRALILTPTRELAAQIDQSFGDCGKYLALSHTVIFGGVGATPQIEQLRRGCDILVATPGRLLDLQGEGHINLSHVEILVLDEADRMLDMGFIHDVRKILALLPAKRQNLLFSATFSDEIRVLAREFLHDPKNVQVTPPNTTVERIRQLIYPVGRNRKTEALLHLVQSQGWEQVLVFTRTKHTANQVAASLSEAGVGAMALHGNKSQGARTEALERFKAGELRALVATDIAARGIDIYELPQVVNYDIPNVPEDYVHRIGRTGRAGAEGKAASLVCMDEEGFMNAIERFTGQQIPVEILPDYGPAEGEQAEPIAMGRQVLWGGLGETPGREVIAAAARRARQEMHQRMRENRAARGDGGNRRARQSANDTSIGDGDNTHRDASTAAGDAQARPHERDDRNTRNHGRRGRSRGRRNDQNGSESMQQRDRKPAAWRTTDELDNDSVPDHLPRNVDPLQINLGGRRSGRRNPEQGDLHEPDPMRTSADMMGRGKAGARHGRSSHGPGGRKRP